MKSKRNASIELIRILSMLLVETAHCLAKSGALTELTGGAMLFYWWLEAMCICSVNIFVLITGYYSLDTPFRAQRIWRVLLVVWSYSFLTSWITFRMLGIPMTARTVLRMLIPILSKQYWFVNAWLALAVLSPCLNRLIRTLSKEQFQFLLGFLLLILVIRPSFLPRTWGQDSSMGESVFFFTVLYFIAAWIRLYGKPLRCRMIWLRLSFLVLALMILMSRRLMLHLGTSDATAMHFYGYDSVLAVAESVVLLLIGLNRKPIPDPPASLISRLAKNSFSVYILHFSLNRVLWGPMLHVDRYMGRIVTGFPALVISVVLVYFICVGVEELRLRLFHRLRIDTCLDPVLQRWDALWA